MGRMKVFRASGLAVLAALVGCQALLDTGVAQCDVDADCVSRGSAFEGTRCVEHDCTRPDVIPVVDASPEVAPPDPRWACVGQVKFTPPSSSVKVTRRQRVERVLVYSPVAGSLMEACTKYDTPIVAPSAPSYCSQPLATSTSDADGYATLEIPKGFDGYLATHPAPSLPNMVPTLYFAFPPPAVNDAMEIAPEKGLLVLSTGELSGLVSLVSPKPVDPARGYIFIGAYDCQDAPAAGLSFEISTQDPDVVAFYDATGIPSAAATETLENGRGGFVNVPAGATTVDGFIAATKKKIASYTILVRAGFITYLRLVPSPL